MEIRSAEDFSKFLRWYLERERLSQKSLALKFNRPQQTIGHWCTYGLKTKDKRDVLIRDFPEIFALAVEMEEVDESKKLSDSLPLKKSEEFVADIALSVKIELGRQGVFVLSDILQWFLRATPEARNSFRDELGDHWKTFLDLTRAMTGESAFKMAIQEGRVKDVSNRNSEKD